MLWDVFCRVIDNHGDLGVCWRLATELGQRGHRVRLWVDDASALAWMAPGALQASTPGVQGLVSTPGVQGLVSTPGVQMRVSTPGVQVLAWTDPAPDLQPGAVVVEAFGCTLPAAFVAGMAAASPPPVWINLEYLSAEPYGARCHGLASPQRTGPGAGLKKWFFFPGFTAATGGLIQGLIPTRTAAQAWARAQPWRARPGERAISVFCYANPALPALLQRLAGPPTVLWLAAGPAQQALAAAALPAGMRAVPLPPLSQTDFDRLLAAADLNLVRGEDSFVRAQLVSGQPFLWQAYPQHDGAHAAKLAAFLDLYLAGQPAPLAGAVRAAFEAYNGLAPASALLPERLAWCSAQAGWQQRLLAQPDLCSQLLRFVLDRR